MVKFCLHFVCTMSLMGVMAHGMDSATTKVPQTFLTIRDVVDDTWQLRYLKPHAQIPSCDLKPLPLSKAVSQSINITHCWERQPKFASLALRIDKGELKNYIVYQIYLRGNEVHLYRYSQEGSKFFDTLQFLPNDDSIMDLQI